MHNKPEYPTPDLFTVVPDNELPEPMLELKEQLAFDTGNFYYASYDKKECIAFCVHKQVKSKSGSTITIVVPIFVSIAPHTELFLKLSHPIGQLH